MSERMRIQRKREKTTAFPSVQSETFQGDPTGPEHTVNEVPSIVQEVLSSSGQPLDAAAREFMEPRFGHDFSQVRVHTDERAVESAEAVNALAYTVGSDVVFGQGQYAPGTQEGKQLLAHELTHVVQQRNVSAIGPLTVGPAIDSYEQEADAIGTSMDAANNSVASFAGTDSGVGMGTNLIQRQAATGSTIKFLGITILSEAAQKAAERNKDLANSIDTEWYHRFQYQFDNIDKAVEFVGGAMIVATNYVKAAHEAQDKADELATKIVTATFSLGIAWMIGPEAGELMELFEKALESGVDITGEMKNQKQAEASNKAIEGVDPLKYLTSKHQEILTRKEALEKYFANREPLKRNYTDEEWLRFDPDKQSAAYAYYYKQFTDKVKGMEGLKKDAKGTAQIIERNMWAAWIRDYCFLEDFSDYLSGPFFQIQGIGSYIQDRLNEVGVSDLADVTLQEHWYASSSPDDFEKLKTWAESYKESIGLE